jgi:hypothetical protein
MAILKYIMYAVFSFLMLTGVVYLIFPQTKTYSEKIILSYTAILFGMAVGFLIFKIFQR